MDMLWAADGPRTVRVVFEDLHRDRAIAYTTVMTVMDNLYRKGWLRREQSGRAYLYEPARSREVHSAELMSEALADSANQAATLLHFVEHMSPAESRLLRDALTRAARAGEQSRSGQATDPTGGAT
jgi:predicted transcriptional regulator